MLKKDKGLLIVLSGPAGVGKGTVCNALRGVNDRISYSVSATTRSPREGEQEGVNYFYKTKEVFEEMIANDELLEWAKYVDNYYGTPLHYVKEQLREGQDIILEIEVQGAAKVKEKYPDGVFIFLAPPNLDELRKRIEGRGTEDSDLINQRMNVAKAEIEMMAQYDYVVENDQVDNAVSKVQTIIDAEHLRQERVIDYYRNLVEGSE
ncbi:guanylate kinase [Geomicrobium sediminis]|uniref:Guanylate kinase n=1 Tax=Geomicrobium sediminis TaxID=1347788 RepID=A0ABS2PB36_9BACL|nr:guanylate kinase [Geomicrobium sediminis]GAK00253.1 guanylate kinase [Geomicrobium sp. JCM 19055]GAK07464.1 guanylate kinase [Geomicrobium sp. JCM 19038]